MEKELLIYQVRKKALEDVLSYLRKNVFPYSGTYSSIEQANRIWERELNFIKNRVFESVSPTLRLYVIWYINNYFKY